MAVAEKPPVTVVGVELDGTCLPAGRQALRSADVVLGWSRHLEAVGLDKDEATREIRELSDCVPALEEYDAGRSIVLLASGDPLFYGIGRHLNERLPAERLRYVPARSSIQLAFSALKTDYNDALVHSLHGRPMDSLRSVLSRSPESVALMTEPSGNTPRRIVEFLEAIECRVFDVYLCESLTDEPPPPRHIESPGDVPDEVDPLNVVVLLRREGADPPEYPRPGVPDRVFVTESDSMVTPFYQRMMDLGHLNLTGGEVVWDVGACTGSISIEAGRLNPDCRFHAVEEDEARYDTLRRNIRRLEAFNVVPVAGRATEVLPECPDPDRVFLGGSGGELAEILELVDERLRPGGRILANFITLENVEVAAKMLTARGYDVSRRLVTVHGTRGIGDRYTRWEEGPVLQQIWADA